MGAGHPKGPRAETAESKFAKKITLKVLKEEAPDLGPDGKPQTVLEWFLRRTIRNADDAKSRDIALRTVLNSMAYGFGRPSEKIEHTGKIAGTGGRVLVLPEKDGLEKWMGRHKQKEVVKNEKEKPN